MSTTTEQMTMPATEPERALEMNTKATTTNQKETQIGKIETEELIHAALTRATMKEE